MPNVQRPDQFGDYRHHQRVDHIDPVRDLAQEVEHLRVQVDNFPFRHDLPEDQHYRDPCDDLMVDDGKDMEAIDGNQQDSQPRSCLNRPVGDDPYQKFVFTVIQYGAQGPD